MRGLFAEAKFVSFHLTYKRCL